MIKKVASAGKVFQIQRFCIHDGPGIRTTVFMKGCPLRCPWCHNPESKHKVSEIMCYLNKCVNCGMCSKVCPAECHTIENGIHAFHFQECILCGKCVENCSHNALAWIGKDYTVNDVLDIVEKDRIFYDSSEGGMTVSGGEPFYQPEFLLCLLHGAKSRDIHTAVETCGIINQKTLVKNASYVDVFLYDIKETDPERHRILTGGSLSYVLDNLAVLSELNKTVHLRCPIIPGVNDREEHLQNIAQLANRFNNIIKVEIEPYHNLGEGKSVGLGLGSQPQYRVPDTSEIKYWKETISTICNKAVSVPAFD